jgi:HSP20 family molecular chaperone IbpA
MAFFPRTFYHPEATNTSFTPLFRLLDDFDSYSRQSNPAKKQYCVRRTGLSQFQPKFDVREVADAYELHGELPGLSKDDVQIEFTEPQTMVIRGKVERTYTSGTPPTGAQTEDDTTMADTASTTSTTETQEPARKNSFQATVEDDDDSEAHESGFEEIEKPEEQAVEKVAEEPVAAKKQPVDQAKYWLTERSIGEFSRSFSFPARVDQDTVTASFQNGILSVTVPKAKKHESRRITVY